MTTTTTDLMLDLTSSTATTTVTVPAPAPDPFGYVYAFTDQDERPLGSWMDLLNIHLVQVGQDPAHAYLFVRQRRGPRTAQVIGNGLDGLVVVEAGLEGEGHAAVVRATTGETPLVSITCAADGITRAGGRFISLRSYVLTAPATYLLTVLEAARAIQHWLTHGTAPAGLNLSPDNLP